jgi:aryl-phospho-beta-D-glucosidase BglC (GH1 family)
VVFPFPPSTTHLCCSAFGNILKHLNKLDHHNRANLIYKCTLYHNFKKHNLESSKMVGVNESGAEFGNAIPGVPGTDYIWPNTTSIKILMNQGMNIFRIPILMERLAPGTMTSPLNTTHLSRLSNVVSFITAAGGYAIIDSHNFGCYRSNIFTSTSDVQNYWINVATEFVADSNVICDCNNEFHDEPSNSLVVALNQACIDGVRAAGATTQYIFVEGTVSKNCVVPRTFLMCHSRILVHRRRPPPQQQ